jgi:hypothetical protein
VLTVALGITAVLAGLTGTWSPCGFSMVDTLGSRRKVDGAAAVLVACGTFAIGALLGACALYGGLAGLGRLLHTAGRGAPGVAAVIVVAAAALGELRGVRIRPQVRRQVPEPWRRTMPLPVAAGLYGVLLGLGFATFVLTLAVAALAAVCLALGRPVDGLVVGVGFGAGRALPVAFLAPLYGSRFADRVLELMAERPATLRGLRLADGVALAWCALALSTGSALAAGVVARGATDPTVAGTDLAWQAQGGSGMLLRAGRLTALPGVDPALGGPFAAWRSGNRVTVARRSDLQPLRSLSLPEARKLAVSAGWLAYRATAADGADAILALPLARPGGARMVARAPGGRQLGRPNLDGDRLAFHVAGPSGTRIVVVNLSTGRRRTMLRSGARQLLNPTLVGSRLLYASISRCGQQLVLARHGRARVLMRGRALAGTDAGFDPGHTSQGSGTGPCPHRRSTANMLWTTALSARFAYVTLLRTTTGAATLLRVRR